ncbi:AlwI family type II restriction endonuclease [Campylobacter lari]|nr:AlwI family type II restriction endonuclease [Campylobacter lari]
MNFYKSVKAEILVQIIFCKFQKIVFIYLKQLLKTNITIENECVKPFIIALYLLNKHQFLEYDEFVYLLPLCTNKKYTE